MRSSPLAWELAEAGYSRKVIRSALVPVAGFGTRLLPATKSQPKEMLTVARKPIVQYVAEELAANGINQILFITSRNKASIENHFDADPELIRALTAANKGDLRKELLFEDMAAHFFYTRQRVQRGLGDAILCGENFSGEQPFVVALGDSIVGINAQSRAVSRMVEVFESKRASCVVAVEEVPREQIHQYGVVAVEAGDGNGHFRVLNLTEKPKPEEAPSNLAIAGRYVFPPPHLRHDPARSPRLPGRDSANIRHSTDVRRGQTRSGRPASAARETLRHRQFSQLLRDFC